MHKSTLHASRIDTQLDNGSFINYIGNKRLWGVSTRSLSLMKSKKKSSVRWIPRNIDIRSIFHVASIVRDLNFLHPYPAKMLGQIAGSVLLEIMQNKQWNDGIPRLLDPMCGSGTTLVYGQVLGWEVTGMDLNPLAVLISKVKTQKYTFDDVLKVLTAYSHALEKVNRSDWKPLLEREEWENLRYWFDPFVLRVLAKIHIAIEGTKVDEVQRNILRITLSSIVRRVSRADPEVVPPTISKRWKEKMKIRPPLDVEKEFQIALVSISKRLIEASIRIRRKRGSVIMGDARATNLRKDSRDLILCSPPYFTAHDYLRSTRLEMLVTGLVNLKTLSYLRSKMIGLDQACVRSTKVLPKLGIDDCDSYLKQLYTNDPRRAHHLKVYLLRMREVFKEMCRVLKSDGELVLVVGDGTSKGMQVPTARLLTKVASFEGLNLSQRPISNSIVSRGFMTKRNVTAGVIDSEWILRFSKV